MSAEEALLGACISAAYALPAALEEGVVASDFAGPNHQDVWAAICRVAERLGPDEHIDPALVAAELNGRLEAMGGVGYLHVLVTSCPVLSNARQYAREVMNASLKRKVLGLIRDLEGSEKDGGELLAELQERAFALERRPRMAKTIRESLKDLFEEANNPTIGGCRYPWREVDYCTRGLRPGWLTYLAAETSVGKTAAALEIADHVVGEGKTVLFASLEMTPFELAVRLAQRHGFNPDALYGRKEPRLEDFQALSRQIGEAKWERFRIESAQNVGQIGALVRRAKPDLVIVDYIQLLDIGKDGRVEGTTKNSRALKMLAQSHHVPVLALCQLSRGGREERGKMPGLWRLRDSGALEQDGDAVVFVWRKRSENGGLLPEGKFVIAKARMGNLGEVEFHFDGRTQRFHLVDSRHDETQASLGLDDRYGKD